MFSLQAVKINYKKKRFTVCLLSRKNGTHNKTSIITSVYEIFAVSGCPKKWTVDFSMRSHTNITLKSKLTINKLLFISLNCHLFPFKCQKVVLPLIYWFVHQCPLNSPTGKFIHTFLCIRLRVRKSCKGKCANKTIAIFIIIITTVFT